MKEKLIIKNFGPIKSVELELGRVNVLIGDQGTGKSTVAKVLTVVKEVIKSANIHLTINGKAATFEDKTKWFDKEFRDNLESFGIMNYLNFDSSIEFKSLNKFFKYENQKVVSNVAGDEQKVKENSVITYVPAFREACNLLKNSYPAIALAKAHLPSLFHSFSQNLINASLTRTLYDYSDMLKVQYTSINGHERIVMENGKEITFEEASSAINSLIPLLLVFDNAVESNYPRHYRITHHLNCPYIIIEEPELNCFPTTQKKLVEHFISKIKYHSDKGLDYYNNLVVTTHSPYILASLNNLMEAHKTSKIDSLETSKILEKKYWLNPDDVCAYIMLPSGYCEDIFDREEGLIKSEKIDDVSNILNEQFTSLLNLEFAKHEFNT